MRKFIVIFVVIAISAVFFAVLQYWNMRNQNTDDIRNQIPNTFNGLTYDHLVRDSLSFSQAIQFENNRQFDKAQAAFEAAMHETDDPEAQGIVSFRLATLKVNEGKYMEAIDIFKKIIIDAKATRITRAYSFLEMASLYYKFSDPSITDRIFEGDVYYKAAREPHDVYLTYRHLFEEASTLYPVALSEIRVADWYANQMVLSAGNTGKKLDAATQDDYKKIIAKRVENADLDLERIKNLPNEYERYGTQSLLRRAILVGKLTRLDITGYGSVDEAFQTILNAFASRAGTDGYARYYYASALSKMTDNHDAQIRTILAPLYTNKDAYQYSTVLIFFKNENKNILDMKKDLVVLATIDPQFKKFLVSLGWQSSDFK